jgi:hypothetical protein
MKRSLLLLVSAITIAALAPATVQGAQTTGTFLLVMEAPNFGVAPNGDEIEVTGGGEFAPSPKSVTARGEFTHHVAGGDALIGTWTATELISFSFYGCGVIPALDPPVILPDDFCGGALKMRVTLDTPLGQAPGIMTVFCIIGEQAPSSHNTPPGEGVTLNVPGIINFNHTTHGMNVFIRTS